jgi:hypothetical protein
MAFKDGRNRSIGRDPVAAAESQQRIEPRTGKILVIDDSRIWQDAFRKADNEFRRTPDGARLAGDSEMIILKEVCITSVGAVLRNGRHDIICVDGDLGFPDTFTQRPLNDGQYLALLLESGFYGDKNTNAGIINISSDMYCAMKGQILHLNKTGLLGQGSATEYRKLIERLPLLIRA